MLINPEPLEVEVRQATMDDAQAIGAVFDAAVRARWTYLGEHVERPMFAPEDWDRLVAEHAPPNVLLVATDHAGQVIGYTAAHPGDGEMFLLFRRPGARRTRRRPHTSGCRPQRAPRRRLR